MSKRDYYEVLGVDRTADADTIKKSYRRLAMKYHPDRTQGDPASEEKFKEIQAAYACLSDEQKRAVYDRFGHEGMDGMGGGGFSGNGGGFGFEDIFSDIFGGGGRRSSANRKQQRVFEMSITFAEMATGCEKNVDIPVKVECNDCDGSGAQDGETPSTCGKCGGRGQVQVSMGPLAIAQTCDRCNGKGTVIDNPCHTCRGKGKIQQKKRLAIKIPAGIEDRTLMRLNVHSVGEELIAQIFVSPHPIFQRDRSNLHVEIPITFTTAALGGAVEIPTVTGNRLKVKIPEGVQNGQILRVGGSGLPSPNSSSKGNLMCHIIVETPVGLNDQQKTMLKDFAETLKNKHTPKEQSWLDKIKSLFTD